MENLQTADLQILAFCNRVSSINDLNIISSYYTWSKVHRNIKNMPIVCSYCVQQLLHDNTLYYVGKEVIDSRPYNIVIADFMRDIFNGKFFFTVSLLIFGRKKYYVPAWFIAWRFYFNRFTQISSYTVAVHMHIAVYKVPTGVFIRFFSVA